MGNNQGYQNEILIAEALNGKTFNQINQNLQSLIRDLFGYQEDDEVIESGQVDGPFKPDIFITYKGQTKYISIKVGRASMVHGENIKQFILFLRSLGVSEDTQKILLYYHFGDGTMDGTGKRRLDNVTVNEKLSKHLRFANEELNTNHELIEKALERFMFQGISDTAPKAEYIYFGSPEFGKVVSKKQILSYVNGRSWRFFKCVHIGPIFFRPHARYSRSRIISQERRERVYCYWPNLADDLDRISKRFTF